jgi:hypothetical protein
MFQLALAVHFRRTPWKGATIVRMIIRVAGGIGLIVGIFYLSNILRAPGLSFDQLPWPRVIGIVVWDTACLWAIMGPIGFGGKRRPKRRFSSQRAARAAIVAERLESLADPNASGEMPDAHSAPPSPEASSPPKESNSPESASD